MSSSDDDSDASVTERVLLSYLAAYEECPRHALYRSVGRHPGYAHELLLLAFEGAAAVPEETTGPIPPHVRDRLLVAARVTLMAGMEVGEQDSLDHACRLPHP